MPKYRGEPGGYDRRQNRAELEEEIKISELNREEDIESGEGQDAHFVERVLECIDQLDKDYGEMGFWHPVDLLTQIERSKKRLAQNDMRRLESMVQLKRNLELVFSMRFASFVDKWFDWWYGAYESRKENDPNPDRAYAWAKKQADDMRDNADDLSPFYRDIDTLIEALYAAIEFIRYHSKKRQEWSDAYGKEKTAKEQSTEDANQKTKKDSNQKSMPDASSPLSFYYSCLGIGPNATPEERKEAFRKFAKENHPDKFPDPEEKQRRTTIFQIVNGVHSRFNNK